MDCRTRSRAAAPGGGLPEQWRTTLEVQAAAVNVNASDVAAAILGSRGLPTGERWTTARHSEGRPAASEQTQAEGHWRRRSGEGEQR